MLEYNFFLISASNLSRSGSNANKNSVNKNINKSRSKWRAKSVSGPSTMFKTFVNQLCQCVCELMPILRWTENIFPPEFGEKNF